MKVKINSSIKNKKWILSEEEKVINNVTGLSQEMRFLSINFISETYRYCSKNTKGQNSRIIAGFFRFLIKEGFMPESPNEFGKDQIRAFLYHMEHEKCLKSASISKTAGILRKFYTYLYYENFIDDLRILRLLKVPPPESTPTPKLTEKEVEVLLLSQYKKGPIWPFLALRDKFIIALLLYTGMRRSEACRIKIGDIRRTKNGGGQFTGIRVKGRGKEGKNHNYPFGPEFGYLLDTYLEDCRLVRKENKYQNFLLFSREAPSITDTTIYEVFKKRCKEFGIYGKSPHGCRVTVTNILLTVLKMPIRDVAAVLGHKNTATTDRYDRRDDYVANNISYSQGKVGNVEFLSQEEFKKMDKDLKH